MLSTVFFPFKALEHENPLPSRATSARQCFLNERRKPSWKISCSLRRPRQIVFVFFEKVAGKQPLAALVRRQEGVGREAGGRGGEHMWGKGGRERWMSKAKQAGDIEQTDECPSAPYRVPAHAVCVLAC